MLRKFVLIVLACTLLLSTAAQAGFIGYQLSRQPIQNFVLTTQNGSEYNFDYESNDIIVVSFIFTRCPDVCPVLTQSMKSVELLLTEKEQQHVSFISITTDPQHDTPEKLDEFTQIHQVTWPHLTGTEDELLPIWATFGIAVQNVYEDDRMATFHQDLRSNAILVQHPNGTWQNYMIEFDGWTWTQVLAQQLEIEVNASNSDYGHFVTGFNHVQSGEDWWWELRYWNDEFDTWVVSNVGIDDIDVLETPHFAWLPSSSNFSRLDQPDLTSSASMTLMYPNETIVQSNISSWNGFAATSGAFMHNDLDAEIVFSQWGHYLSAIDQTPTPSESWWWQLATWNESATEWEESQVGMDEINATIRIAWIPSTTNISEAPSPSSFRLNSEVCGGHGWLMGENETLHCMCDQGYSWSDATPLLCVEDRTKNYTIGHSTATYILDADRTPRVMWAGDQWKPEDVVKDVRTLMEKENTLGVGEPTPLPGFSFANTLLCFVLAILISQYRIDGPRESRKK